MEKTIGIMGAMPEEIAAIIELLEERTEDTSGMRTYHTGYLKGKRVVVTFSRWGKVAAAVTVAHLILKYSVSEIYFTGVAGAIDPSLKVGDVVIGKSFFQHDIDARPLMSRFEVPLLGISSFESDPVRIGKAFKAANSFLSSNYFINALGEKTIANFNLRNPKVIIGVIGSGDKFYATNNDKELLRSILPEVVCVEMEGASVAQVCFEYKIPFTIIRTISDSSNEASPLDFPLFIKDVANIYSTGIIERIFEEL